MFAFLISKVKYVRTSVGNENHIYLNIKSDFKSGDICNHSI